MAQAALYLIPAVISAFGNYSQGRAAKKMGERRKIAAEYESAQLEQGAGQAIAVSQRAALEENRRARLVASRALALAGASGAGASDTTIQKMMADLAGEGSYRASVALYQGEERARLMRMGAQGKSYEGEIALQGGRDKQRAFNLMAISAGIGSITEYKRAERVEREKREREKRGGGEGAPSGDAALLSDGDE